MSIQLYYLTMTYVCLTLPYYCALTMTYVCLTLPDLLKVRHNLCVKECVGLCTIL